MDRRFKQLKKIKDLNVAEALEFCLESDIPLFTYCFAQKIIPPSTHEEQHMAEKDDREWEIVLKYNADFFRVKENIIRYLIHKDLPFFGSLNSNNESSGMQQLFSQPNTDLLYDKEHVTECDEYHIFPAETCDIRHLYISQDNLSKVQKNFNLVKEQVEQQANNSAQKNNANYTDNKVGDRDREIHQGIIKILLDTVEADNQNSYLVKNSELRELLKNGKISQSAVSDLFRNKLGSLSIAEIGTSDTNIRRVLRLIYERFEAKKK